MNFPPNDHPEIQEASGKLLAVFAALRAVDSTASQTLVLLSVSKRLNAAGGYDCAAVLCGTDGDDLRAGLADTIHALPRDMVH